MDIQEYSNGTERPLIQNCKFYNNTGYPITVNANDVMALSTGNLYSGNGVNEIHVLGEVVTDSQTWLNQGIPFYVDDDLGIYASGGSIFKHSNRLSSEV